ncbi:MAG: ketopantoate reductase family protein [Deltaproteobacteria bacterium]|nr:ketopantoate reductase family protein [Deltaproteobacteria bacterium]
MKDVPEKVGIIGSGVVGSVLAAHLANAGKDVCVVDVFQPVIDAVREHGIRVDGILNVRALPMAAVSTIREMMDLGQDLVVICVKSTALRRVADDMAACDDGEAAVMSFQNGLDTEEVLAELFPRTRVFRGVVNYAGAVTGPGRVRTTFFHPPNHVGCLDQESSNWAINIAKLFTDAGLPTEYVADIRNKAWRKTILNACLMPVSVITRLPMNHIMETPETREIVVRLMKDFMEVAKAEGHVYEDGFVAHALEYLDGSGGHKASMLMDFEAGNPLEMEFLNAKIQEYADRHHVPCETNRLLLALVRGLLLHRDLARKGEA